MKPVHQMTKLERERAKLREIKQQLGALHVRSLFGSITAEDANEYTRLRLAKDICLAAIAQYETREEADHA
jgi:hypothetical protein